MSSEEQERSHHESISTSEEELHESFHTNFKVFLLGYIPRARHNLNIKSIANDLLSHYYVSMNSSKWVENNGQPSRSRSLVTNSDVLLFFINEQTISDSNCLLTLQYAWHTMLPIILLRPPMTKLVITNRNSSRSRQKIEVVSDGCVVRSSAIDEEPWHLVDSYSYDTIDYSLLQDILYEGYKISILYESYEHTKSMCRIRHRLANLVQNLHKSNSNLSSSSHPHFYLSPSNHSINSMLTTDDYQRRKYQKCRRNKRENSADERNGTVMRLNLSQSTGNLNQVIRTPTRNYFNEDEPFDKSGRHRPTLKSPPPPERIPSSVGLSDTEDLLIPISKEIKNEDTEQQQQKPVSESMTTINNEKPPAPPPTPHGQNLNSSRNTSRSHAITHMSSITSRTSSLDRRMSLSCLEDMSNYQKTQYLVFPLRDSTKKPYLVKFPDQMHEEDERHNGSVWGSDTSLEEEIKNATKINAGINVDYEDESPIQSPAPYLGSLL